MADHHPDDEVARALRFAESEGWVVKGRAEGHRWATVTSPDGMARMAVWASPKDPATHARQIWRAVMRHPTAETGDQREQGEHDLDDELAPASVDAAVQAFGSVTDELLAAIARDPKILYRLHWRQFEELVAELLDRQGFDVTLTPPSRDGGIDIYARRVEPLGSSLYVVECKRYGPEQPIGPDLVRTLYGVVERVRATRGILATTSFFTLGARKEAAGDLAYRITLRDGSDITRWIRRGPDGQVRG